MIGAYDEVIADMREVDLITRKSIWVAGREYWPGIGSDEYLDVVKSGSNWYRCIVHHLSGSTFTADINAGKWKAISWLESVATSLLMSENAIIDFLQNNELRIQKADGTVTAGASGKGTGVDGIRFWAGSSSPNKAPFRVNENGGLIAENAEIAGKLKAGDNSEIAGMRVIGNSLRGVQAIMGIYKHQITGNGSAADRDIIVNNILQQQTYLFSITSASNDIQVRLPSHRDMIQKGIEQYQFEITIVLDNGSTGSAILFRCNDDALIVHGLNSFSTYGLGKGGVLKLLYFQNRYYLISNSYAQTSPW